MKTRREALEHLRPGSHHLVIADVRLPDGYGHEIAAKAAELGIKTLLMSGHPDELQALIIGDVVHLAKPFTMDEFQQTIETHLPVTR